MNLLLVNNKKLATSYNGILTLNKAISNFKDHPRFKEIIETISKYVEDWKMVAEKTGPYQTLIFYKWDRSIAELFFNNGLDINHNANRARYYERYRSTPLMQSAYYKNDDAVKFFLEKCADTKHNVYVRILRGNDDPRGGYISLKSWVSKNSTREIYKMVKKGKRYCQQ